MTNKRSGSIYWSLLSYTDWTMYIAAIDEGLCFVGSQDESFEELEKWAIARYPKSDLIQNDDKLLPYKTELIYYLQGTLENFTIPVIFQGTPFQEAVWNALLDIPYGQIKSYSDIAQLILKPAAVRAVGAAIGANPILITVPCHRVVGKNGKLTGYRGGIEMKTRLLMLEGVSSAVNGEKVHV